MIDRREVIELINALFEEEALLLGGLVAVHELDDDFVWRFIKSLDVIRDNTLRSLDDRKSTSDEATSTTGLDLTPHPAIEDFLLKLRRS